MDQIVETVNAFSAKHVVVTGGEPMIAPEIVSLTQKLRDSGHHITIETAGTVYAPVACDLMSISPKLANSTPYQRDSGRWAAQHERLRYQPEILRKLVTEFPHQLKFVVASPDDLEEIKQVVADLSAKPEDVILMPEGTDTETLQSRGLWIAEICKQEGYRFSPRLHVDLWGAKRGV